MAGKSSWNSKIIVKKVCVSADNRYFAQVAQGTHCVWVEITRPKTAEGTLEDRLRANGLRILTDKTARELRSDLETIPPSGECLVADCPGWVNSNVYVHADGSVQGGLPDDTPLIQLFAPNDAYRSKGTHNNWLKGMSPFYDADRGLRFVMWFALSAIVLHQRSDLRENPMMEVVGEAEAGKTTLCRAVASMFGGGSGGGLGIGYSANMTANAFLDFLPKHNDSLFFLDETNVADANVTSNMRLIFNGASGSKRSRYGDTQRTPRTRTVVLLTGNLPLSEHSRSDQSIRDAARTRLITKVMDEPLFRCLPEGYPDRNMAISALSDLIELQYGTASRKLIDCLIDGDTHEDLDRRQRKFLEKHRSEFSGISDRIMRLFALIYAVGKTAMMAGVLPKVDVHLDVIAELRGYTGYSTTAAESWAKREFVRQLRANCARVARLKPEKDNGKKYKYGAWHLETDEKILIYLTNSEAESWFGDKKGRVLKLLKEEGVLFAEPGKNSIKPPRIVPTNKRVYKFVLSADEWPT